MLFGNKIKELREEHGLLQRQDNVYLQREKWVSGFSRLVCAANQE